MREITTEIELTASPELVWQLLTTFELYESWNPLFRKAKGTPSSGSKLDMQVEIPGLAPFSISAIIQAAEPMKHLEWRYHLGFAPLFAWEYGFRIDPIGNNRLCFSQQCSFRGLMAPLYRLAIAKALHDGCENLSNSVKRWGERGNMKCMKC